MGQTNSGFVGYEFLRRSLEMPLVPLRLPARTATVTALTPTADGLLVPNHVAPTTNDVLEHILFALKHEGTELGILRHALPHLDEKNLHQALLANPNSSYLRITGFLWEYFTGGHLQDLPTPGGTYAAVFSPRKYLTGPKRLNTRWRVNFNGLGSLEYCPVVRRTDALEALLRQDILAQVNALYASTAPQILDRALSWAYLHETEGSFALEGESPEQDKAAAFIRLLHMAHEPRAMNEDYLVELQNSVVSNPFELADQYRTEQNWLRRGGIPGPAGVSYVPPRPADVAPLMQELEQLINSRPAEVDDLVLAALASFGFVFIHPFMDGNGRLSRFLLHYVLCQSGLLPRGLMLPVSIAIKRHESEYLDALKDFSGPTRELWRVVPSGNDYEFACTSAADSTLYRYWDATACVTFTCRMALETLNHDLKAETEYLLHFDSAYQMANDRVDLRNQDLIHLLTVCIKESGRVSKRWRRQLGHRVPDEAFSTIEWAVQQAFAMTATTANSTSSPEESD